MFVLRRLRNCRVVLFVLCVVASWRLGNCMSYFQRKVMLMALQNCSFDGESKSMYVSTSGMLNFLRSFSECNVKHAVKCNGQAFFRRREFVECHLGDACYSLDAFKYCVTCGLCIPSSEWSWDNVRSELESECRARFFNPEARAVAASVSEPRVVAPSAIVSATAIVSEPAVVPPSSIVSSKKAKKGLLVLKRQQQTLRRQRKRSSSRKK